MDCLLLHVPQVRKNRNQIMVMPMGLFPLASELNKAGITAEILHYGLRREKDPSFSLTDYVEKKDCKVVALNLHWHGQTYDVINVCSVLKKQLPYVKVILGGYMASCFHDEIIRDLPFVDFVIRGDGEQPLIELMQATMKNEDNYQQIPNLSWKTIDGALQANEIRYRNTPENTSGFCHTDITLMRDHEQYFSDRILYKDFTENESNRRDYYNDCFFYNPGKGCSVNCSFCGGGTDAQASIFGRKGFFFYVKEKALRDIEKLKDYGISTVRTCFDPDRNKKYYKDLFDILKTEKISFRMIFDLWSLPDIEFMEKFKNTFRKDSLLVYSADCGPDHIRKRNKGFYSSNAEIINFTETCRDMKILCHIFLSYGLPHEKKEDLSTTADLIKKLKTAGAKTSVAPMFLDPFSPMFARPEEYEIQIKCKTAADFYRSAKGMGGINYVSSYLAETEILEACNYLSSLCE